VTDRFVCPPDHAHAENLTCRASHGCKCDDCTTLGREYEFWRRHHRAAGRVPAIGSIRRIRALNRLGWSRRVIGEQAGMSEDWVSGILRHKRVAPATAAKVRAAYDVLSMRLPEPVTPMEKEVVRRSRAHAEKQGWPPPLAWDESKIDEPDGHVDYDARRRVA
jgi:hypothetical protein